MKNKFFLFCMVIFPALAFAQTPPETVFHTVRGILADSLTLEGEPYATIKIVNKEDPELTVKMAVTDTKGKFSEKVNGTGTFIITLSSIGKSVTQTEYTVTSANQTIDLGTLHTSEAVNELGSIEVVAQKPLVKVDVDKLEYNIEDDPDSKTNSVLEMLRKVPLVTVDGEDKIQVNGSSNFKVHVNGKPNSMMSDNPTDVLKSMPANTIKYIEVITNPGAKYDAEGVGGILNIVTVGGGFEGYTATFTANASNTGGGGSAYATIKKDKLTLTGNYSYNKNSQPRSYSSNYREDYTSAENRYLSTTGSNKNKYDFQQGNIEASYELDTLRLITMSVGMYGRTSSSNGRTTTEMRDSGQELVYNYLTENESDNNWFSVRGNIDYQRSFSKKDRLLTFSYKINTQPSKQDYYNNFSEQYNIPAYLTLNDQYTKGKAATTEHTFQADYTTPIGKYHTIETGVKYIVRNNTSDSKYYMMDNENQEFVYTADKSTDYKHLNDILAAYAGYNLRYKSFTFKPGLRYEHTIQNVKYADGNGEDFKVNFDDVVPSVALGMKVGKSQNIRGGYNMRIWRPGIYFLNPYRNDQDPLNVRYGNPDLETEKSHNFDLSFNSSTAKLYFNIALRHNINNKWIEDYSYIEEGVTYTTYANIGKYKTTGLSGYVNWNASSKTRIYMNANVSYTDMTADPSDLRETTVTQRLHNYGWSGYVSGGAQHTFPKKIRVSLNGGGGTPHYNLQGKGSGWYYYTLNVNRAFLNDRLTVSGFVNNIFEKYREYNTTTNAETFMQKSSYKYSSRRFGISVSYRIGELKASVKKAARSIDNDDVKGGGEQ